MGGVNALWFPLLIFLFVAIASSDDDCVYTAYIQTGKIKNGGTKSNISLTLYDAKGWGYPISNLEAWGGIMGPDHHYFKMGNLDIFSGKGQCLTGPVCHMDLTSDGSDPQHGWYCDYVQVTISRARKNCTQHLFTVEQWLATHTSPYVLTAVRYNDDHDRDRVCPIDRHDEF